MNTNELVNFMTAKYDVFEEFQEYQDGYLDALLDIIHEGSEDDDTEMEEGVGISDEVDPSGVADY